MGSCPHTGQDAPERVLLCRRSRAVRGRPATREEVLPPQFVAVDARINHNLPQFHRHAVHVFDDI